MSIRILFFASLRETLGCAGEQPELPEDIRTVAELRDWLARRGDAWTALTTTKNLRVAVNQSLSSLDTPIKDGDEIAFFPPVTGG